MGCTISSNINQVAPLLSGMNNSAQLSQKHSMRYQNPSNRQSGTNWAVLLDTTEARKKFFNDGTLPLTCSSAHLELRELLENPLAQSTLLTFAQSIGTVRFLTCWIDIQEFKIIPVSVFRRSKALNIYHKYIRKQAPFEIEDLDDEERINYKTKLKESRIEETLLSIKFFNSLQKKCFLEIFTLIFTPFFVKPEYEHLILQIKNSYNKIKVEDFEFIKKLGEGGFGFVVHCVKISTGKHYAMKIQSKKALLANYRKDPRRVDFEKQAFAACHHPFIINLDYAFQTAASAIFVLGLATAGDLNQAIKKSPNKCLSESRVIFYAAELTLALTYMHQLGLMYRDLKPHNILLGGDGHVRIVDMGSVIDTDGKTLGTASEADSLAPIFSKKFRRASNYKLGEFAGDFGASNEDKKRKSIMGTIGYMAPEMQIMMSQPKANAKGYSDTVDWWSLGATMYKLLTGNKPFDHVDYDKAPSPSIRLKAAALGWTVTIPQVFAVLEPLQFPDHVSITAVNIISRFLDADPTTRLGAGKRGFKNIREHPFFHNIEWERLEQRLVTPPYVPEKSTLVEEPQYESFEDMLNFNGKGDLLTDKIDEDMDKRFFGNWDFISMEAQRVEFGLATQMEQYEANIKVRQLLGEKDGLKSMSSKFSSSIKGAAFSLISASKTTATVSIRRPGSAINKSGKINICNSRKDEDCIDEVDTIT